MRLLIFSSVLSISALIRKASAPTLRWRPFWLKLLNGDDYEAEFKFLALEASYSEDVDTGGANYNGGQKNLGLCEKALPSNSSVELCS